MPNETIYEILQIPVFWRAAITLFVIWFIYMLACRGIFKLLTFVPSLINWVWYTLYRLVNNVIHPLHKSKGESMIGVDQSVTDFFGGVYAFFNRIKFAIESARHSKSNVYANGNQQFNPDGTPKITLSPKKPFCGAAFALSTLLVFWIAAPTWLDNSDKTNIFTSAYHKYVEVEGLVLDMLFAEGE